jgi:hypothetical protein
MTTASADHCLTSALASRGSGRCPLQPGCPHIDVREVIWVATSNISERLVFEHEANRVEPGTALSRVEYVELMKQARYQVSEHLGVSNSPTQLPA